MRPGVVLLAAALLSVTAPATALATPTARKPAKIPAFHAALSVSREQDQVRGSLLTLSTKGSRLPAGDRLATWTVAFSDGTKPAHGARLPRTLTHLFGHHGAAEATLTLVDVHGHRTATPLHLTVAGSYTKPGAVRLTATSTAPRNLPATGETVSFGVSAGLWKAATATATVDFGDGTSGTVPADRHHLFPALTHAYTTAGSYRPTVTIRDNHGGTATAGAQVLVGVVPSLVLSGSGNAEVNRNYAITVSTNVFGAAQFGHVTATGPSWILSTATGFTVTWSAAGSYLVTDTYTDYRGESHTVSLPVTVYPVPGMDFPDTFGSTQADPSTWPEFYADIEAPGHTWTWRLDAGGTETTGSGPLSAVPVHFTTPCTCDAYLYVTLDDGRVLYSSDTVSVTAPPTLTTSQPVITGTAGNPVTLSGLNAGTDPAAREWAMFVQWDSPDGDTEEFDGLWTNTRTHLYATPGTYTAEVTVEDDHGGYATTPVTFSIA